MTATTWTRWIVVSFGQGSPERVERQSRIDLSEPLLRNTEDTSVFRHSDAHIQRLDVCEDFQTGFRSRNRLRIQQTSILELLLKNFKIYEFLGLDIR